MHPRFVGAKDLLTSPITESLLTVPYVGVAEFKAAPTWLDNQDLVESGDEGQQDAELFNQLLKASAWAVGFCDQPLHAHAAYEATTARVDRWGRMWLHPKNNPVRSVTGLAYGVDFQNLTNLSNLDQVWVQDQRGLVISMVPMNGAWMGTLQFGSVARPYAEVYVQYQYVAGYANTYLTAVATSGQNQLTVADPTGFTPPSTTPWGTPYGGSIARIWDPAQEEAISVTSSYTLGANPVTLSANLANNHQTGVQVSEFPPQVRQAIVSYACALMLREDVSEDPPFPGSPGPTARRSASRGVAGGLIEEAERGLMPFRRTR
jgi:hypothetical protein